MTWQMPKTNWVPTDAFTAQDYGRIRENAAVLREEAARLYVLSPGTVSAAALPEADDTAVCSEHFLNGIETAVAILPQHTYQAAPVAAKVWRANASTPAAADWNRIEGTQLALHLALSAQQAALPVLALTLGGGDL